MSHVRMLRASSLALDYELDVRAIGDPTLESGVPGGNALMQLVDAVLRESDVPVSDAQREIIETLGPEALVDAAAVFGNFEMMNRVAEGSGIPIPAQAIERQREDLELLGLDRFIKE